MDAVVPLRREEPDDLFLVAASFEDRCRRAAEKLSSKFTARAIVFQYEDTLESVAGLANGRHLKSLLTASSIESPDVLPCRFGDPFSATRVLDIWLQDHRCSSREPCITIDVTCFTKLHILLLLRLLEERLPQARIRILYTEPQAYATAFGRKLTYGISDTFYIPLNSGHNWGRAAALFVFLGHEPLRAERVIEEIEAEETILIQGEPGYSPEMARMSERMNRYLLNRAWYNGEFKLASCSTYEFTEVATLLSGLVNELDARGIGTFYVAPLGTKLQALGIDYVRRALPEKRLIVAYPAPARYEKKYYSQGMGPTYSALLIPRPEARVPKVICTDAGYDID